MLSPHQSLPLALLLIAPLAAPLAAQGADDCNMAQPIAGPGVFNFDNTGATTDGSPDGLCLFFGQDDIELDVWFAWTAAATSQVTLDTCNGQTSMDSKIAIYDGSCAGAILACVDDSCGTQTSISWNAIAGQVYLIRLGRYPNGGAGDTGTFTILENIPIINPANGHAYLAVAEPNLTWDQARMAAEAMTFNGSSGYLACVTDDAEDTWIWNTLSPQADLGSYYLGGFQDLNAPGYSEPLGGWTWISGEPWVYADWWPGEPNDNPAPEDFLVYIPTNLEPTGMWNDGGPNIASRGYVVEFGGLDLGMNYCTATTNSTGSAADISATGSVSVASNNLTLHAQPVPTQPGLFYYGPSQLLAPFGNGFRCVGGVVGRLAIINASGDLLSYMLDNTMPPNGAVVITPGSTWNFQAWYRDPAGGGAAFNLSDGLQLTFEP